MAVVHLLAGILNLCVFINYNTVVAGFAARHQDFYPYTTSLIRIRSFDIHNFESQQLISN
jgi:hypothetical protein